MKMKEEGGNGGKEQCSRLSLFRYRSSVREARNHGEMRDSDGSSTERRNAQERASQARRGKGKRKIPKAQRLCAS